MVVKGNLPDVLVAVQVDLSVLIFGRVAGFAAEIRLYAVRRDFSNPFSAL